MPGFSWRGGELPAVTDTEYGTRECPEELADRLFRPQWQAHVAPIIALADLEHLGEQLRSIQDRVEERVRLAAAAARPGHRSAGRPG